MQVVEAMIMDMEVMEVIVEAIAEVMDIEAMDMEVMVTEDTEIAIGITGGINALWKRLRKLRTNPSLLQTNP